MTRARVRSLLRRCADLERKRPLDQQRIRVHVAALRAGAAVDGSREAVCAGRIVEFIAAARESDVAEGEDFA